MKQMTRREFIKCAAAFSATAAGIPPFNLSLTDTVERRSGELVVYPFLYRFVNKSFQIINIKLWGCNWNCRWCTNKFAPLRNATPTILTINEITALVESAHLKMHLPTLLLVSGGEPLHQRIGALELIEWMKRNTDFVVGLETNGSLLDDEFIERANRLKLDRIDIAFRHIDDGWHRWYTGGHSNRRVVNALRLATETFDGLIGVPIILFPEITERIFEKICKLLYQINSDFIIKMMYPIKEPHTDVNHYLRRVARMGKIASQYFYRIFPDPENVDLHLPREMVQFEIKPRAKLTRSWRWSRSGGELA